MENQNVKHEANEATRTLLTKILDVMAPRSSSASDALNDAASALDAAAAMFAVLPRYVENLPVEFLPDLKGAFRAARGAAIAARIEAARHAERNDLPEGR